MGGSNRSGIGRLLPSAVLFAAALLSLAGWQRPAASEASGRVQPVRIETDPADLALEGTVRLRGSIAPAGESPARALSVELPAGYRAVSVRLLSVTEEAAGAVAPGSAPAGSGEVVELLGDAVLRGVRTASLRVRPVRVDERGAVFLRRTIEAEIALRPERAEEAPLAARRPAWNAAGAGSPEGARLAAAPGDFQLLSHTAFPSLDGGSVEYLIIAPDSLRDEFQPLADWHIQRGIPAAVRSLEAIAAEYTEGVDLPDRLRHFLRDAYSLWGTRWVLLGGDIQVVPMRLAWNSYDGGEYIATDLYYGALDGTWDGDGDGIFCERDEDFPDLLPEIHVGRAPVETAAEAVTFVSKTLAYARDPELSPDYVRQALLISQILFCHSPCVRPDSILLNGGDLLDAAFVNLPAGWDTLKIYEWPHQNQSFAAIHSQLDLGHNLVAVSNHGDPFKWSTGDGKFITIADALALANSRRLFNLFFMNCNTSELEAECVNEATILDPNGGAVTVTAPTRFDYPHVGVFFVEEYYRLFFQARLQEAGALIDGMRIPFAGVALGDPAVLWNYTAYILLGDPALRIWEDVPDTMALAHAPTLAVGDSALDVVVTVEGLPVEGAVVTVWNEVSREYGRAVTDAAGFARVPFEAERTGTALVTASHPAELPAEGAVTVLPGIARLHVESVSLDDDALGLSNGNGDGLADAGERIELGVTYRNASGLATPALGCTLSLGAGSKMAADLLVDGVRAPGFLFAGASRAHPAALPCTLRFGGALLAGGADAWGKPRYQAAGTDDSTGLGVDSLRARAYLWEDAEGWHLRAAGGYGTHVVSGFLDPDGAVTAISGAGLEPSDSLAQVAGVIGFRFELGADDCEDGFDLVADDSTHLAVLVEEAALPLVAPGGSAVAEFLVEVGAGARDGERRRPVLRLSSGDHDGVPLELHGAALSLYHQAVDDSALTGDADGVAEPGETIVLWPRVRNAGRGLAEGVQATLRAVSGATVLDSLDLLGDIEGGALLQGLGGFTASVSAAAPVFTCELRDAHGRTWSKTFNLTPPGSPAGLKDVASPSLLEQSVDLTWTPRFEADVWGYLVYRAGPGENLFTRLTAEVIPWIGYFQDRAVSNDSLYRYYVTAVDSAGTESPPSAVLSATVRPAEQPGWPQSTRNAIWAPVTLADLDLDGESEVIAASLDGRVYVWDAYGALKPGWPRATTNEIWTAPAVGNLDADPQLEIVTGSNDNFVYAWNHDGTGLIDTSGFFKSTPSQVRGSPTLADFDGDGTLEIMIANSLGRLYCWRRDGTGFLQANGLFKLTSPAYAMAGSPTVADVNGDRDYEIFDGTLGGRIYALHHNATGLTDPSGIFASIAGLDSSGFWGSLAVGDLQGDGTQELVGTSWNGNVYVWNMSGALLPGWPVYVAGGAYIPYEEGKRYSVWSSAALGDLDGDHDLEIVVGSRDRRVYALHHTGAMVSGWPYVTGYEVWGGPVLADLDDDGLPEVLCGSLDNSLHAVNGDGTRLPGWPIRTGEDIYSSPAVGDIDGDGTVEVAVGSYDGYVHVWDVDRPWRPASSPWPQFHHDTHHSGWSGWESPFQLHTPVEPHPGAPVEAAPARVVLAQNVPNPGIASTAIRFGLPRAAAAKLTLFDVGGRRVRVLADGPREAGWHEIRWDGRDADGAEAAAGIYFYRLETAGGVEVRKLVLAR